MKFSFSFIVILPKTIPELDFLMTTRIAFLKEKRNSHDIEIYWILCKCEKSNYRSKENRNQRELLSFFYWQR